MMETEVNTAAANPDQLEVAPGVHHEDLEGWVPDLASDSEIRDAMEKAFDYRGDVTLTLKTGERLEAYIFDRKPGSTLQDSFVRLYPVESSEKRQISYGEIARIEFSGKDRAAGTHWEDWVKKYNEKKARGEKNIGLHPESLD